MFGVRERGHLGTVGGQPFRQGAKAPGAVDHGGHQSAQAEQQEQALRDEVDSQAREVRSRVLGDGLEADG